MALEIRFLRKGKKDMHTVYDGEIQNIKNISREELKELLKRKDVSEETKAEARRLLDPEDRDQVIM